MKWICSNCSSANEGDFEKCFVCGAARGKSLAESNTEKQLFKENERLKLLWRKLKRSIKKVFSTFEKAIPYSVDESLPTVPPAVGNKQKTKKGFASPWPEHSITINKREMKSKGFVCCERDELKGVLGYRLYSADGSSRFLRWENLVLQNLADRKN